jgi:hypothetical protein
MPTPLPLLLALLACGASLPGALAVAATGRGETPQKSGAESASPEVQRVAVWVLASHNNRSLPFLIVDKLQARVFIFQADGRLLGASAALIGLALGDESVPGIGDRKLASIRPDERTTPAGRFAATPGLNLQGHDLLWVDYESGVSIHRVIAGTPSEQRAKRLASPTSLDNRITYGCVNLPASFFDKLVMPALRLTGGIVYILPDTRSVEQVFGPHGLD